MKDKGTIRSRIIHTFIILGILIGVFLFVLLLQKTQTFAAIGKMISSVQALLFGLVISCLISPLVNFFEGTFDKKFPERIRKKEKVIRGLAVAISMGIMIFIIVAVLLLIIPQISVTLTNIIPSFGNMIEGFNSWFKSLSKAEFWQERVYPYVSDFTTNISNLILSKFGVGTEAYTSLTSGIVNAFSLLMNLLVGVILAVYLQMSKEKLFGQVAKLNKAIFQEKVGGYLTEIIDEGARIFSGFFSAKILEAILMGVMNFAAMMILQLPYATLISVVVGAANIIPFFGPYIGTILGAAVIILVDPWQALIFVIVSIAIVQIDGNILGPRILGHSTGLSPIWVVVAIFLFTGCFGIIGAFIGVPVFAWIYYVVKRLTEASLQRQDLPTDTAYYEKNRERSMRRTEKKNNEKI